MDKFIPIHPLLETVRISCPQELPRTAELFNLQNKYFIIKNTQQCAVGFDVVERNDSRKEIHL